MDSSEAHNLNARIAVAQGQLASTKVTRLEFAHDIQVRGPYVVVLLPGDRVSSDAIRSAALPAEAKDLIEAYAAGDERTGPAVGVVQANEAEWVPLTDGVAVDGMLYAWKQQGEAVRVTIALRGSATAIESLR
jgi:hypothetical protein